MVLPVLYLVLPDSYWPGIAVDAYDQERHYGGPVYVYSFGAFVNDSGAFSCELLERASQKQHSHTVAGAVHYYIDAVRPPPGRQLVQLKPYPA